MPSVKYSCSGSPDMLMKGSTAIEGLSGSDRSISPGSARWALSAALPLRRDTVKARTGSAMFFTLFAQVVEARATLPRTAPRTASETVMPPGSAKRLQPGGDVHAVAIDRAVGLLDHVAQVHADAKAHAAVFGHLGSGLRPIAVAPPAPRSPRRRPCRTPPAPSRQPCRRCGRGAPRPACETRHEPHPARPRWRVRHRPSGASSRPRRPPGWRPGDERSLARPRVRVSPLGWQPTLGA